MSAESGHRRRRRRPNFALSQYFSDRQSESQAFAESVRSRDEALHGTVDLERFENVLLYYGFGGVGKTQLSLGLQSWIQGDAIPGAPSHWGPPPHVTRPVVAVRWDLNDSAGNLDALTLLMSVRAALHGARRTLSPRIWRAFDVAFAAYTSQVRPGQPLPTDSSGSNYDVDLPRMVTELALEAGLSMGAGVGATGLREVSRRLSSHIRTRRVLGEYPDLPELLEACMQADVGSVRPDLVGDLLFLIDGAVSDLPPKDRPLVVVFVDHLERVQQDSGPRVGERVLNQLVASLPHALFVMTGRNRLDWWQAQRTSLEFHGRSVWPCLAPDRIQNPRAHALETLSRSDARDWIRAQAAEENLPFAPGVVDSLVEVTGCWPVHIDAVFALARVKTADGDVPLELADFAGSFDDVVRRLLEDLPSDERSALQAACLLPYFDEEFVLAVGGQDVTAGALERLLTRAVVLENHGSRFAYRIHDEIRRAVKAAGPSVPGGWAAQDWLERAARAFDHALAMSRAASRKTDDEATIAGIGLALTLAAEYGVSAKDRDYPEIDALVVARRRSPSHSRLLSLVPPSSEISFREPRAVVRFIETICMPINEVMIDRLAEIGAEETPSSTDALLYRAYRLRSLSRYEEAAAQLRWLRDHAVDREQRVRQRIYSRQVVTTLFLGRQFREAESSSAELERDQRDSVSVELDAVHGHLGRRSVTAKRSRARNNKPIFRLELRASADRDAARAGILDREGAEQTYQRAVAVGHVTAQRLSLVARALHDLAAGLEFDEGEDNVLQVRRGRAYLGEILAFKALRDGVDDRLLRWHTEASEQPFRSSSWIPTEMLLKYLDHPLPPVATHWLEPEDAVYRRWVSHYLRLLGHR